MKKVLLIIALPFILTGCLKKNDHPQETFHFAVIATNYNSTKLVDVYNAGVPRRMFTGPSFESDLTIGKGLTISISSEYVDTTNGAALTIVLSKNNQVIAIRQGGQTVSLSMVAP
ncbi:MAG TPA: hypothetical protein VNW95_03760 [Mucilaginibacter sp.]|jgi:hypothetical protein|nr:hypothetical protein [Mucilaginibacter sp.]